MEDSSIAAPTATTTVPTQLRRRLNPGLVSFLTSFIAHTAFLILLALIVIQGWQGQRNSLEISASIQSGADSLDGSQLASVVILPPQMDEQAAQANSALTGTEPSNQEKQEIAENIGVIRRFQPEQEGIADAAFRLQKSVAELALVSDVKAGGEADAESGKPGEAVFFGARAYGTKFVFVIDASTSMEGYRWNRATGELLKSIGRLENGTEFFIIAFHFQPVPINLSNATSKTFLVKGNGTVVECRKWLRSLTLAPQTMPASSLQLALDFEPDAIFLLSDGELRDNSLALLRTINRDEDKPIVPINTIHLFSSDGKETLEKLAEENGGSFTAVGGRD